MVKIAIAVSALCLVWTAVALADSAIAIRNDGTCSMAGADADGNVTFGGNGQVATELENGNKDMMKCKGSDITNLSGGGQNLDGFECGIMTSSDEYVVTTDSHATVSASGMGTMTCTYTFEKP